MPHAVDLDRLERRIGLAVQGEAIWPTISAPEAAALLRIARAAGPLLERYVALVRESGACRWDPETDPEVRALRAALAGDPTVVMATIPYEGEPT